MIGPRGVSVSETALSAVISAALSSDFPPVLLQARIDDRAVHIETGCIEAGVNAVVLLHCGNESFVAVDVEVGRIRAQE